MRLLHADSLTLEEFFEPRVPPYAILSHTWDAEEVSFQDLHNNPHHHQMAGYGKIKESCRLALFYGLKYVWIDTCCIDKSSSAELSEAINSMFRWYENSAFCFVYLPDVPWSRNIFEDTSAFGNSRWHTRGWTLQELLAPRKLIFFASNWKKLFAWGNSLRHPGQVLFHTDERYTNLLRQITGIEPHASGWEDARIATKLSWISRRETTRVEDIAYCLLGVLGVQMPLLYGEGDYAFQRLLINVMERDNSYDIFLAGYNLLLSKWERGRDYLLPRTPAMYGGCSNLSRIGKKAASRSKHYSVTNAGLHIEAPIVRLSPILFLAFLYSTTDEDPRAIALPLR
ncbi:heterokaryon incompatibility protein-domain-containing protein, partial [Microdochium trichocladiopsis]